MPLLTPLLWVALSLSPQVHLPRPSALAAATGDEVELERLATRLGPARLLRLAGDPAASPRQRVVALRSLGLSGERHPELAAHALLPLALQLQGLLPEARRDPRSLEVGAEAALRLCRALGASAALGLAEEAAADELPQAATRLAALAGEAALTPLSRERLVLAVLALPPRLWPLGPLVLLTAAGSPLRELVLGALSLPEAAQQGAAVLLPLLDSEDRELALAAVLALCDQQPVPAALPTRARALAQADPLPVGERQRLSPCLRRLGTPQDEALLLALQAAGEAPVAPRRAGARRGRGKAAGGTP